ncbi:MAG: hypothetical protein ACOX2S_07135 [bacterium]
MAASGIEAQSQGISEKVYAISAVVQENAAATEELVSTSQDRAPVARR